MASSKDYLQFVLEQLSELQEITYRAMMGEFIIYYRGKIVGGIYDDRLLVKPTKSAISYMPTVTYEIPYENAKEMLLVEEVDNKFGIGGANMPTRTPIPVSRAMRQISANLDLARRQQRIPVALLAERAGLSMPTVTKMLRTGNGSFENFLRIARLLGLLDGVQQATDPLNTDIGKLRADEDTPKRIR